MSDSVSNARRRSRRRRQSQTDPTPTSEQITYRMPPYNLLSKESVRLIHDKSMRILSELGIDFYDEECREILSSHGAKVEGDTVFFDEELVMEHVGKAPQQFVQMARNPRNNVTFGGNRSVFAPVYGPPFVHDIDRGRREATLEDFNNFVKLTYMSPYLHYSGGTLVEPNDEPVPTRHLDMVFSHIKYSDKAFMGSVTDPVNADDSVAMAEILFGRDAMNTQPALLALINVSSPRRHDERMLGCLKVYARARQAILVSPFLMAGAMSPAAVAATMALQNAEALSGIALIQMINPGTPVIYGSFMTNLDLQSGATVFGSPASQLTLFAVSQMARLYELPFRTGGTFTSSKVPDAQAGYESVQVMLPAVLAQTNFILHAAGWLESGLAAGYEKFMIDCELLGMYHRWSRGIDLSDEGFAFDAFQEVPPGGHFLGTQHTMRSFRDAFHRADLFDYDAYEQWVIRGSEETALHANKKWKAMLESYKAPDLDTTIESRLIDFVAERKRAFGFR